MPSDAQIPKPALVLGLTGAIPFVGMAAGTYLADPSSAVFALNAGLLYGAVILSFLGGVHWGRALSGDRVMPDWSRLGWSVTPGLIAWASAFVPDAFVALGLFVIGFTAAFFVDARAVRAGIFPAWYGRLRKALSIIVLACLLATAFGTAGIVAN